MNYDIFDENYYLLKYPFLKEAITAGLIKSGLDHFQKYGQKLGLTEVSRYYNESYYLEQNPFVATAVKNGVFASGLDYFIQYGYEQGGANTTSDYDETFYLQRHPEIIPFIQNGAFKSGFQHFIKFGQKEGRYATSFFEPRYLRDNPGVADAVSAGVFKTGREHYVKYGQFEPARSAVFTGTNGNDIVTGFGVGKHQITGLQVALATTSPEVGINLNTYETLKPGDEGYHSIYISTNEFDTLIGTPGADYFVLGDVFFNHRPSFLSRITFYTGIGEATIVNFEAGKDYIQLAEPLDQFNIFPSGSDLLIQLKSGDTIGRIQGGANLNLKQIAAANPFNTPYVGYTLLS